MLKPCETVILLFARLLPSRFWFWLASTRFVRVVGSASCAWILAVIESMLCMISVNTSVRVPWFNKSF